MQRSTGWRFVTPSGAEDAVTTLQSLTQPALLLFTETTGEQEKALREAFAE